MSYIEVTTDYSRYTYITLFHQVPGGITQLRPECCKALMEGSIEPIIISWNGNTKQLSMTTSFFGRGAKLLRSIRRLLLQRPHRLKIVFETSQLTMKGSYLNFKTICVRR